MSNFIIVLLSVLLNIVNLYCFVKFFKLKGTKEGTNYLLYTLLSSIAVIILNLDTFIYYWL